MRVFVYYGFFAFLVGIGIFEFASWSYDQNYVSYTQKVVMKPFWFYPEIEKELEILSDATINDVHQRILEKYPDVIEGEDEGNEVINTDNKLRKWLSVVPDPLEVKAEKLELPDTKDPSFERTVYKLFEYEDCISLRLFENEERRVWRVGFCINELIPTLGCSRFERNKKKEYEKIESHSFKIDVGKWKFPNFTESTFDKLLYVEQSFQSEEDCQFMEETKWKANIRYQCNAELEDSVKLLSVGYISQCEIYFLLGTKSVCEYKNFLYPNQRNVMVIVTYPYIPTEKLMQFLVAKKEKNERNLKLSLKAKLPCTIYYGMRRTQYDSADRMKYKYFKVWESGVKCATAETDFFEDNSEFAYILHTNHTTSFSPRFDDYVDYESVNDEDRGHFWYYMNSPEWDKCLYPRKLYNVAVAQFLIDDSFTNLGISDGYKVYTMTDHALMIHKLILHNNVEEAAINQLTVIYQTFAKLVEKYGTPFDRVQEEFLKNDIWPLNTLLLGFEIQTCDFEYPIGVMTRNLTDDFLKFFEVSLDDFIENQYKLEIIFGQDIIGEYPTVVEYNQFDEFREKFHQNMLKYTYPFIEMFYTLTREYHRYVFVRKFRSGLGQDRIDDCFAKFHQYISFRLCEQLEQKLRAKLGISDSGVPSYDVSVLKMSEIPLLPQDTEMFHQYEKDRSIASKLLSYEHTLRFAKMVRLYRNKNFQFHKKWIYPTPSRIIIDLVYSLDYNSDTLLAYQDD